MRRKLAFFLVAVGMLTGVANAGNGPAVLLDKVGNVIGLLYVENGTIVMRPPSAVIRVGAKQNPTVPPDGAGLTGVAKASWEGVTLVQDPDRDRNRKAIAGVFLAAHHLLKQGKITEQQARGPATFDLVPKVIGKEAASKWKPWQQNVAAALNSSNAGVAGDLEQVAKGLSPNTALNPVVIRLLVAFLPVVLGGDVNGELLQLITQIMQELF